MNAAKIAAAAPEAMASSIAGLTAIVAGSNHNADDAAPAMKAAAINAIRIREI